MRQRDDGVLGCSGISWTIGKQSAPRSRQITTPIPHHSIFYRPDALNDVQSTVQCQSKTNITKWQRDKRKFADNSNPRGSGLVA